jgi:flagellar basal-body rod protein FlgB
MVKQIPVTDCLEAALRAANLRQTVIANNIANLDTPGYRRQDVQFGDILAKALQGGNTDVSSLEPKIIAPGTTEVNENGNDVDLDMEVGEMIKASGHYKTCVRLLAKLYQRMQMAMQVE